MIGVGEHDILVSIDPGTEGCGVALFCGSTLHGAGYAEALPEGSKDPVRRALLSARAVHRWVGSVLGHTKIDHLVLEFPQTYGGRAAKGDANSLFPLAAVDGAILALFSVGTIVTTVTPHSWKGSVPKPKSAKAPYMIRERVTARLTAAEEARVAWPKAGKLSWDVADAVGIGLSQLGRFERRIAINTEEIA